LCAIAISVGCVSNNKTTFKPGSAEHKQFLKKHERNYVDLLTRDVGYGVYLVSIPNKGSAYVTVKELYSKFESYPVGVKLYSKGSILGDDDNVFLIIEEKGIKVLAPNPSIFSPPGKEREHNQNVYYALNRASLSKLLSVAENRRRNLSKLSVEDRKIYNNYSFPTSIQ
jgi:hypothetical protein